MVMKKNQCLYLRRSVGKKRSGFFGMAFTAALGFAMFYGLNASAAAIRRLCDSTDLEIYSCADMLTLLGVLFFALFFTSFAVSCVATCSRLVESERTLIGAQRALGATQRGILDHYLAYGLICGLCACLIGIFLGILAVELPIITAFKIELSYDIFYDGIEIPLGFSLLGALIPGLLCIAVFLASLRSACRKLFDQPTSELMNEKKQENGSLVFSNCFGIFSKLNYYSRTVCKTAFSERHQALGTIIGTTVAVVLIVTAFLLIGSVTGVFGYVYIFMMILAVMVLALVISVMNSQINASIDVKSHQLAIMRINGYSLRRTKAYVFRESLLRRLVGAVIGVPLGVLLGYGSSELLRLGTATLVYEPTPAAVIIAVAVCALIAIIADVSALRRVDNLSLTDIGGESER